ncbi:ABC transporter permease [Sphaerisporangium perillae]|uniref:ABC transporter permease n=1 Tax=Sphaerisporangium perillae TaxID=2935860 RepID=UPI00200CBDEE|nr:ABC transporter permease [Sphaerisporangium perillae]
MLTLIWLRGLLTRRTGRLAAAAAGVAMAVALPAALGMFLASAKATMTARSVQRVAVDWQVEMQPGAATPGRLPGVSRRVDFAAVGGFEARQAGQTLTTGAGQALGLPADYTTTFPGELRLLTGTLAGPLLAQQTAANLHATPGSTVILHRPGLPDAQVRVTGIVELPEADSLFQKVGAPATAQPQAPPDNVLLLPAADWHHLFDTSPPDKVRTQFHVRLDHALPPDPAAAYTKVTGAARNLEAGLAGTGLVGDNLGAALGAAREDALYSQLLFLFLGVPGAVLAILLTATVTRSGAVRRSAEQALLRTRGASRTTFLRLALAETLAVGVTGALSGLAVAALTGWALYGSPGFGGAAGWAVAAAALGLLVACATVLPSALGSATVTAARRPVATGTRSPAWLRYGLDLWLVAAALVVFRLTSGNGYHLVLVPEGLPQISVDYWAFTGPALLWAGAGLLIWRLTRLLLGPGRPIVTRLARPLAAGLAGTVTATLARQRGPLSRTMTLAALAVAFAVSTAVFDATYRQQAQVDAELTNGADVTATQTTASERQLAAVPGVSRVEPLQHGFAYVGADLQDVYGIRPSTILSATHLQDTYFPGGTARQVVDRLARSPDALLVSQETVNDFQLHLGDMIRLRMQDGRTVPFHYAGIVTEFPTAPRDSFLVANASYLAASDTTYLIATDGTAPHLVADRLRARLGPGAKVSDVETTRRVVGSSLTAVDLTGLTAIELGYGLALAAAATGLLLILGFTERRRTFALARVLGARPRQLGAFIWTEVTLAGLGAAVLGGATGWALAQMLVTVLTGVFDPAPDHLAVPWPYLGAVTGLGLTALLAAGTVAVRAASRPPLTVLRDL